jgi:ATP adenylyltransferase
VAGGKRQEDPFMQPEAELFVADIPPVHYALLNKYNVLDRHLLVVTRAYVDQDEPLDRGDFEALAACMGDEAVLGFYNGGKIAGASQRHKHLQIVRLPLSPREEIPVEAIFGTLEGTRLRALPVRHAFARVGRDPGSWLARYQELRRIVDPGSGPYNLLVARDWMLLVPRSRESFGSISVNSLAFAGGLFVRNNEELRAIERAGPMAVLRGVAFPEDRT